jgi:hypothetical protein
MSFRKNFGRKQVSGKNYLYDVVTLNNIKPIEPINTVTPQIQEEPIEHNVIESTNKIVELEEHTVTNEDFLLVRTVNSSTISLNKDSNEHIVIKSLTNTTIKFIDSNVDEEFNEITIGKGACVELYRFNDNWYVISSDGVKND